MAANYLVDWKGCAKVEEFETLGNAMRRVLTLIDEHASNIRVYKLLTIDGKFYSLIFLQS